MNRYLFSSDNGFFLGERGLSGKWLAHDVSMRVPLVIFDPRVPAERRGKLCDKTVLNIDLAPTILALAGVPAPEGVQGRSLAPLLQAEEIPWRSEFFYEHLFQHARIPECEAVRDGRLKYIRYVETDPPCEEFYDLQADPHEAENLAAKGEHTAALDQMRQKWQKWREAAK